MQPDDLIFPAAYCDSVAYYFERSDCWSASYFGGPSDFAIRGPEGKTSRIHHISSFTARDLPIGRFGLQLPLFYGIQHSGCRIRYRVTSSNEFELIELVPPQPAKRFPYPEYPSLLPYIPLRVAREIRCGLEEFAGVLCQQAKSIEPSTLLIAVPASPVLGVSLWGPTGDAECVQMIFECDISTGTVRAFNQCG